MTEGTPWSLAGEPLALLRYVQPAEVARHVQLPGRSGESRLARLRAVYAALQAKEIGYSYAAPGAEAGMQVMRPPEQVLWAPRHATCLDLAVVLAGACLTAELHPIIVVLEPPGDAGVAHSLVLVRLDRDLSPRQDGLFDLDVWQQPPADLLDELQHSLDGPGDVVAIDPVGLAVSLGTESTPGLSVELAGAVVSGARHLTAGTGWRLGVDIGSAWRRASAATSADLPTSEPLRAPYRAADTAESPLRLLRAEYAVVPFQNRDELTVLLDWCRQTTAGDSTGLAVVTGIGGSGKTRLALELANRLRREGWYAGTFPKGVAGADWLAGVVSPVLVVLDYADGRVTDATALLAALRTRRESPAVVLLTARAVDGDWLANIVEAGQRRPPLPHRTRRAARHPPRTPSTSTTAQLPRSPPRRCNRPRHRAESGGPPWTSCCWAGSPPREPRRCPPSTVSSTTRCWATRRTTGPPSTATLSATGNHGEPGFGRPRYACRWSLRPSSTPTPSSPPSRI